MSSASTAIDLSDAEKRDLIALIQAGKALPDKYRFLLFEDKREVELVWNGKTRDVCTTVLPFQTLEHVTLSPTSSSAPAPPPRSPKSSAASGSRPTSASSASTPPASA